MKMKSLLFILVTLFASANVFSQAKAPQGFAVMELFTSQGCSSCPAADEVLAKYALGNNPNIFPLAFHVDYWNRLGWKDPFSRSGFSDRQRMYSQRLNTNTYTPQLVINGTAELVGSNVKNVARVVDNGLKTTERSQLEITAATVSNDRLAIRYDLKGQKTGYLNAALVKKKMTTDIKRGENSGQTLINYNIVYDFITEAIGAQSGALSFDFKGKAPSDFCIVLYTQETQAGKVLAAARSEIK